MVGTIVGAIFVGWIFANTAVMLSVELRKGKTSRVCACGLKDEDLSDFAMFLYIFFLVRKLRHRERCLAYLLGGVNARSSERT